MTDAEREKIKLHAAYANGVAIALVAVGTLAPLTIFYTRHVSDLGDAIGLIFLAVTCLVASGSLHLHAYRHLDKLD